MQASAHLKTIRKEWLQRSVHALAHEDNLQGDLFILLNRFYDNLEQAVETQNPACLDPILNEWSASLTQSDLEGTSSSLTSLFIELTQMTYSLIQETFPAKQAIGLVGMVLPYFSHAFEVAAQYEMQVKVTYLTEQLEQTRQTLEKLDRSKSDFIAVAAHELKTPLTLIDGYAAMLQENLNQSKITSYQSTLVEGIQTGTQRLRTIVDDMIDVSMIDNNLLSLNFQPVWINRLFSVLTEEVGPILNLRSQKLDLRPFPGIADLTFADPERLLQVFRNVLTNAIKYTPDGGEIVVHGRRLPGFIEVTVTDTGIGIDIDDVQLIFDKFVRLGNSALHSSSKTKFKGGGPGLGLHIAKGIIESHGGAIWAESSGHDETACPGSTFHILVPLRSEPPDSKMAKLFAPLLNKTPVDKVDI